MDITKILNISKVELPRIKTLTYGYILIVGFAISINNLVIDFANFIGLRLRPVLYPALFIIWTLYWIFYKYYLPRNKKDKVGIVIAIYSENERERQQLKLDFIAKLKKDLKQEGLSKDCHIIFLKNHFSNQIFEADDQRSKVETLNKKIKAHFYVFGDIKKRPDGDDGEKFFLYFQGFVTHKPIPRSLSRAITLEFSKALPQEINFFEKRGFKGFETSATLVHLAAKYIIGIAALVSNDPQFALRLHTGLKDQFNAYRPLPPNLQDIRNRIPILISDEKLWISRWHFENNRLNESRKLLYEAIIENSKNYGAWLFKAIFDFLIDENVAESVSSIKKAERCANDTYEWRYSKAFLFFWKGDYISALNICGKIRKQNYRDEELTLAQVRRFNLDILNRSSSLRPQLYFWMGYLSYFKEGNLPNALDDFEKFEKFSTPEMFVLKQKSTIYLQQIKIKMS